MWQDIGIALCLVLVIEGIVPFLYPRRWRALALSLAEIDDRTMRIAGFASMMLGTLLLYLIK
ncbi:MAG: DUF2065 domain-containing protein [Pseudomonadales bacterium]